MNKQLEGFQAFAAHLSTYAKTRALPVPGMEGLGVTDLVKTVEERTLVGKIYNRVVNFLNEANLYDAGDKQFSTQFAATERLSPELSDFGRLSGNLDSMLTLCTECQIPDRLKASTILSLANQIARFAGGDPMGNHWHKAREGAGNESLQQMQTLYPQAALNEVDFAAEIPGNEAFGATIDTVLPDLRMAMTIVLLRPHRGIMSRLMHRRSTAATVVQYIINYDELYALDKSQDVSSKVRNSHDHKVALLHLYKNPDPADMSLIPIVPKMDNDEDNSLLADGIIRFNKQVNLLDLTMDPDRVGYRAADYTDLVSDGVTLSKVYLTLKNNATPAKAEQFVVDVSTLSSARLHMQQNTDDSADRGTICSAQFQLVKGMTTSSGALSELLATVPDSGYIKLAVRIAPEVSLKTANATAMASGALEACSTVASVAPAQELIDLVNSLTLTFDGYELDAKYSEENVRKTNMAVRSNVRTRAYEIPVGRNIVVDYSMQQAVPEHILATAQEVQSIGIDHRNVTAFLKALDQLYDRIKQQNSTQTFVVNSGGRRVNDDFVSGQRVNPYVFRGVLNVTKVSSVRSSDMLSDLRQFVESYFNKALSVVHLASLHLQQLNQGEQPTYKVLTSGPIIENLFSVPHIHNHLMPNGLEAERIFQAKQIGEPVEYRRVLPSGVVLECITTPFDYMKNKILIVPYRPGDPDSEINFGHNWDYGQFVAHYTPVSENKVNKRVFQNTREWPIITCPVAMVVEVVGLKEVLVDIAQK